MRWIGLFIGLGMLGGGLLLTLLLTPAPRPRSYHEAVMRALDRRGVPYREVRGIDLCPSDRQHCLEYLYRHGIMTGRVSLVGGKGESVVGRIICGYYGADCTLSVEDLGVHNAPLANLSGMRSRPSDLEIKLLSARILVWRWVSKLGL